MWWTQVCVRAGRRPAGCCVWLQRSALPHKLNGEAEGKRGKRSVRFQIWLLRSVWETKCQAERYYEAGRESLPVLACLSLSLLCSHTESILKFCKWAAVKQAWERDPFSLPLALCRTLSTSRHLWAVTPWLWYPLVTAMNFPLLSADYTPVTKLDEWHAWQWM